MKAILLRGILSVVLSALLPSLAFAQHLSERAQWQPQTAPIDSRLDQPVEIEIIGRAAVPALEMLSEQTRVSLAVAPEDLDTIGERKLTIIAKGLTLKATMAQLPEALRECHWDIDRSGTQPVYLLHRHGSAERAMAQLADQEASRQHQAARTTRVAGVEAAREALAMSPEELAALEQSDLLLARSVRSPESRAMLELFLSLPQHQMQQFLETGDTAMDYAAAPKPFQQAAARILEARRAEFAAKSSQFAVDLLTSLQSDLPHLDISYADNFGGVFLRISPHMEGPGPRAGGMVEPALWPQFPPLLPPFWYRPLFRATGAPDDEVADTLFEEWRTKGVEQKQREKETAWVEPSDPELHRPLLLESDAPLEFAEVEGMIAEETGFSVISDYFTTSYPLPLPAEARSEMPVWRLLYVVCEHRRYRWRKAGSCLVFHRADWYDQVPGEIPESVIFAYRDKLKAQGRFTLKDVLAFISLAGRPVRSGAVPRDLVRAGLYPLALRSKSVLFCASLSADQLTQACSASGLCHEDMTSSQRQQVHEIAAGMKPPVPAGELPKAVFSVRQSPWRYEEKRSDRYDVILSIRDRQQSTPLFLALPEASLQEESGAAASVSSN